MLQTLEAPGIQEPASEYHDRSGAWLSSHLLMKFIRSPALYWSTIQGNKEKDSPAYAFGRGCHTYILEGKETFNREYTVGGPVNEKTDKPYDSKTKKYQEWSQTIENPFHAGDFATIQRMADAVDRHVGAKEILSHGWSERVIRHKYKGMNCQIRMDWFNGELTDLKTTGDMNQFQADFWLYQYDSQLAFYQSVLALEISKTVPVNVIATEKKDPYRVQAFRLHQRHLDAARRKNEQAIEKLKRCQERNFYPEDYDHA